MNMPRSPRPKKDMSRPDPKLGDDDLLEAVQRQTFRYFWEGAHPVSFMARDCSFRTSDPQDEKVAIGGTGFGVMAIIVAVERQWVTREEALQRLGRMLDVLEVATCYHGVYPHFMNGTTGATIPFWRKDDAADLVETSFLFQGLLCAKRYFDRDTPAERRLRGRINFLWLEVEWDWHTRDGRKVLYWHWSPNNGWSLGHEIRGWNECLITYVLAAAAPRYGIDADVYHDGFAVGRDFLNRRSYGGIELPLGPAFGGPLFFTHYSFLGLDPRGLKDRYADYWQQNRSHARINYEHCVRNPGDHAGYGKSCWGLTASDDPDGYSAHAPDNDNGTISPTAALASFPYAPREAMRALRHFLKKGDKLWARFGFIDAFNDERDWYADTFLAVDQGPIIVMIENYRTGLLWKLFMSIPEIQASLRKLDFSSPHLEDEVS
ncbi:MAG: glucoamylase family protein [Parvibaculaceae bacterium]